MSKVLKRGEAMEVSDYNSDSEYSDTIKKSKTLLSEDSGIGFGANLTSPEEENPFLIGNNLKLPRSIGIHCGLSNHIKEPNKSDSLDSAASDKHLSAFEQYLAMSRKLKNSPIDSSGSSSDDSLANECVSGLSKSSNVTDTDVKKKEEMNKENTFISPVENFQKGLKCSDVESALHILKTRYSLPEVNLKRYQSRLANSSYPLLVNSFTANSFWQPCNLDTPYSKTLREIREEVELKNKKLAELTRLILKRQQDMIDEENKLLEAKRKKQNEEEEEENNVSKIVTMDSSVSKQTSKNMKNKHSKNPIRRAIQTVRRKFAKQDRSRGN